MRHHGSGAGVSCFTGSIVTFEATAAGIIAGPAPAPAPYMALQATSECCQPTCALYMRAHSTWPALFRSERFLPLLEPLASGTVQLTAWHCLCSSVPKRVDAAVLHACNRPAKTCYLSLQSSMLKNAVTGLLQVHL